jgi:hypothetical protein
MALPALQHLQGHLQKPSGCLPLLLLLLLTELHPIDS